MAELESRRLGIDIGGTGVKGAPVDLASGQLAAPRLRLKTPQPATPDAVAETVAQVVDHFDYRGKVGVTFPAVVKQGVAKTAANVDKSWIDADIAEILGRSTGCPVTAVNDADAAGVAEMAFGAGLDQRGVVILATLGTGIGTAVFLHGQLLPNTELGHLEIDGHDAETRASEIARERDGLSWEKWAKRLTRYFRHLEDLLWPDLIIIGGGVSKKADKFLPHLEIRTQVVPAALRNDAGIVGAAMASLRDVTANAAVAVEQVAELAQKGGEQETAAEKSAPTGAAATSGQGGASEQAEGRTGPQTK